MSEAPIRIGMLTTWQTRCGIAAYTGALVEALRELPGVEVTVVPIEAGIQPQERYSGQADELNRCDIVHIQHEYSFWGGYVPGKNMFHAVRGRIVRPVTLTAHTTTSVERLLVLPEVPTGGPFGARLRAIYRRARMRTVAPLLTRAPMYRRWVEVSPFASAERVIVHTQEASAALAARGIQPDRIRVVPAGIPPALPAPEGGRAFRGRHGLGDRRIVTLFGYLTPFKGYELALDALAQLPPGAHLVFAGGARTPTEEPYVEELTRHIAQRGLQDRVTITGFLEEAELAEVMAATEIVAVPHTQATGSYSVTLPLAYARPIIASDLACFRDIHARLPTVELFRCGDSAELGRKLAALMSDPRRRIAMQEEASAFARENSWERAAARTLAIYREALGLAAG